VQRVDVAPDGTFRFEVGPGDYTAVVVGLEASSGWLPPWGQERRGIAAEDVEARPGFFARLVQVGSVNERHELELTAFRAARATGRVVDPVGEPVEGALVRLQARALAGLVQDARTDVDGFYVFQGLYPGAYALEARLTRTRLAEYRTLPPPREVEATIVEGTETRLPELRLRPGEKEIEGSW